VRARNKVERKIRDAIRAGVLPASPSFAQKELLDKIKPHIDDQMLDQIKRAVVAGDIYGHGEVYSFAPADAIRWASSKDWFPRFFFSRKDIASVDKAKSSLMDTRPGPGATLESVEVDEVASPGSTSPPFDIAEQDLDTREGRQNAEVAFLAHCNSKQQHDLRQHHIWKAAGYRTP